MVKTVDLSTSITCSARHFFNVVYEDASATEQYHRAFDKDENTLVSSWEHGVRTVTFNTPVGGPEFIMRMVGAEKIRVQEEQTAVWDSTGRFSVSSKTSVLNVSGANRFQTALQLTVCDDPSSVQQPSGLEAAGTRGGSDGTVGAGSCQLLYTVRCTAGMPWPMAATVENIMVSQAQASMQFYLDFCRQLIQQAALKAAASSAAAPTNPESTTGQSPQVTSSPISADTNLPAPSESITNLHIDLTTCSTLHESSQSEEVGALLSLTQSDRSPPQGSVPLPGVPGTPLPLQFISGQSPFSLTITTTTTSNPVSNGHGASHDGELQMTPSFLQQPSPNSNSQVSAPAQNPALAPHRWPSLSHTISHSPSFYERTNPGAGGGAGGTSGGGGSGGGASLGRGRVRGSSDGDEHADLHVPLLQESPTAQSDFLDAMEAFSSPASLSGYNSDAGGSEAPGRGGGIPKAPSSSSGGGSSVRWSAAQLARHLRGVSNDTKLTAGLSSASATAAAAATALQSPRSGSGPRSTSVRMPVEGMTDQAGRAAGVVTASSGSHSRRHHHPRGDAADVENGLGAGGEIAGFTLRTGDDLSQITSAVQALARGIAHVDVQLGQLIQRAERRDTDRLLSRQTLVKNAILLLVICPALGLVLFWVFAAGHRGTLQT